MGKGGRNARASVVIHPEAFEGDDAQIAIRARDGDASAKAALYRRYASYVARILVRVLGHDRDLDDLIQEVFAEVFAGLPQLREPGMLKGWISRIAVHRAQKAIRKRQRWRWIVFWPHDEIETAHHSDEELGAAARQTYRLLDALPLDERTVFCLRFVEGMELHEVAVATDVSLATVKRRIQRAKDSFLALARGVPELEAWTRSGGDAP